MAEVYPGYRCCSVRHMGEHTRARARTRVHASASCWRVVPAARNIHTPEECTLPAADARSCDLHPRSSFPDRLSSPSPPLPSHPPTPVPLRVYRCYAWPNLVPGEALVVFPQIRCSPDDVPGEVGKGGRGRWAREERAEEAGREGGSQCGAICGERRLNSVAVAVTASAIKAIARERGPAGRYILN